MPIRAELRQSAPVFAALGDPTRLHLVARLAGGEPLSITRLSEGSRLTRQAITKHLHVLEEAGLAAARAKVGNRFGSSTGVNSKRRGGRSTSSRAIGIPPCST